VQITRLTEFAAEVLELADERGACPGHGCTCVTKDRRGSEAERVEREKATEAG
jgi:hypothetical protein